MTATILTEREHRTQVANHIKQLDDVVFPHLDAWNYGACEHHDEPKVDCEYRACGGELFSHQRVGVAWLYAVMKGLLADDPGVGKTSQVLGLTALLKQKNELTRRALIIPSTPAVGQWGKECARWVPGLKTITVDASLPRKRRADLYASEWDVLIIGSHLLISDQDILKRLAPFDLVVSDDVDALLNHDNRTHRAIRDVSKDATRSFTVNATTLQIKLQQLHGAMVPAGGIDLWGGLSSFEHKYVNTEYVTEYSPTGKRSSYRKPMGYKNIDDLKTKIGSVYLRRKATELTDIRMPMIMPIEIEWLEMSEMQRIRYTELQAGVLRLIKEEGEQVKQLTALTQFTYGQQICAGLPALGEPDVPGASPKLDRLFHRLNDVWADRKTIVYVKNVGMVRAAIRRCQEAGFECALIWGQNQNKKQREEQKDKFWDDPNCRVLFGTQSLERSHNLQCANTVVGLDTPLNPARVRQTVGRAARAGSPHDRVFTYQYMHYNTQEERYIEILTQRQAMADAVFDSESELFEALPPLQLLQLMRP